MKQQFIVLIWIKWEIIDFMNIDIQTRLQLKQNINTNTMTSEGFSHKK